MAGRFWLMKSEPSTYSIDDLRRDGVTTWEGVRNYQARNMLRDDMKTGDLVLFYHSSADRVGVAGIASIAREGYPDPTQFEAGHKYEDPAATPDKPRWYRVDVGFVERFADVVTLDELRNEPGLEGMLVLKRGMRLSVQQVQPAEFERVRAMGHSKGEVLS